MTLWVLAERSWGGSDGRDALFSQASGFEVLGGLDVENSDGWVTGDPSAICGEDATSVGPYVGVSAAGRVHVFETGHCFEFIEETPHEQFPAFALPGAPAGGSVEAAFFHGGGLFLLSSD